MQQKCHQWEPMFHCGRFWSDRLVPKHPGSPTKMLTNLGRKKRTWNSHPSRTASDIVSPTAAMSNHKSLTDWRDLCKFLREEHLNRHWQQFADSQVEKTGNYYLVVLLLGLKASATHVVTKSSSRKEPRHCNFRNTRSRSNRSNTIRGVRR